MKLNFYLCLLILSMAASYSVPVYATEFVLDGTEQGPLKKVTEVPDVIKEHDAERDLIEKYLKAVRERDDRAAYHLNTKTLQEKYKDPQSYMREIRREKQALYNHVDFEYIGRKNEKSNFYRVKLLNKRGKSVTALFKIPHQKENAISIHKMLLLQSEQDPL